MCIVSLCAAQVATHEREDDEREQAEQGKLHVVTTCFAGETRSLKGLARLAGGEPGEQALALEDGVAAKTGAGVGDNSHAL